MKHIYKLLLLTLIVALSGCASRYRLIEPQSINYISTAKNQDLQLDYKYDLLEKKYAKKEAKKGVKLVALKITNNSTNDIVFGRDAVIAYQNGNEVYIMDQADVFKAIKQSPASYLWYLLLSPVSVYSTSASNGPYGYEENTNSFPAGLIVGPGLAGANMIAAGSANKKFKIELEEYNLYGKTIAAGETKFGLIGIKSESYDALQLNLKN